MTATPPTAPTPAGRFDPTQAVIENVRINLVDLFRGNLEAGGGPVLEGRTFRNCIFDGPAVLLVLAGNRFSETSFGAVDNDIRTVLLRPVAPTKVIGAIPFAGCTFERCSFVACGFTGAEDFLDLMVRELSHPAMAGQA